MQLTVFNTDVQVQRYHCFLKPHKAVANMVCKSTELYLLHYIVKRSETINSKSDV